MNKDLKIMVAIVLMKGNCEVILFLVLIKQRICCEFFPDS